MIRVKCSPVDLVFCSAYIPHENHKIKGHQAAVLFSMLHKVNDLTLPPGVTLKTGRWMIWTWRA